MNLIPQPVRFHPTWNCLSHHQHDACCFEKHYWTTKVLPRLHELALCQSLKGEHREELSCWLGGCFAIWKMWFLLLALLGPSWVTSGTAVSASAVPSSAWQFIALSPLHGHLSCLSVKLPVMYWYSKAHHSQYWFTLNTVLFRAKPTSYPGYLLLHKHCEWKLANTSKSRNNYNLCWQCNVFLLSKDYVALLFPVMHRWRYTAHLVSGFMLSLQERQEPEYKNSICDLTFKFKSFILRFHKFSWPSKGNQAQQMTSGNCPCWENMQPWLDTVEMSGLISSSSWAKLHCFLRILLNPWTLYNLLMVTVPATSCLNYNCNPGHHHNTSGSTEVMTPPLHQNFRTPETGHQSFRLPPPPLIAWWE